MDELLKYKITNLSDINKDHYSDCEDEEEILIDCTTKIFGKQEYSSSAGVNFDNTQIVLNHRDSNFEGFIFENLNELQIEKAVVLLDSLEELDTKARKKWLELLEEKDKVVCAFINEHHDDYGDEIRSQILEKLKVEKQNNKAFVKHLEFGSFYIFEGDEEDSIKMAMDYSLIWENGTSFTDQILAMHFTDKIEYAKHTHYS